MTRQQACTAYIRLLKQNEDLTPEQIALARASFNEGWHECARQLGYVSPEKG